MAAEHAAYRELLSEAGYRQFIDEQEKTEARLIIGPFAANALVAGMQIPPERLERLVDAVASAQIPGLGWRSNDGRFATWQFERGARGSKISYSLFGFFPAGCHKANHAG